MLGGGNPAEHMTLRLCGQTYAQVAADHWRARGIEAGCGASEGPPGCQPSLQSEQKTKKHLGHCAQLSSSSRAMVLHLGQ